MIKVIRTCLNNGTGNPCAWHNKPKPELISRTNDMLVASEENVGALSPTGSICKNVINQITPIWVINVTCLNIGDGYPWAWQRRDKCWPIFLSTYVPIESVGKVGDLTPIGS